MEMLAALALRERSDLQMRIRLEEPDLRQIPCEAGQRQGRGLPDVPDGLLEGQGSAATDNFVEHCISAAATAAAAAKVAEEGRAFEYECGDAA